MKMMLSINIEEVSEGGPDRGEEGGHSVCHLGWVSCSHPVNADGYPEP